MSIDQNFLESLQNSYNEIVCLPKGSSALNARILSAQQMQKAFEALRVQIKGSENLPHGKGIVFIYNHLENHPYFTAAEGFQITLDSHFISSIILQKYYGQPGTRVVRHSLPNETNHKLYFDRFDYIRVYSKEFTPPDIDKKILKKTNAEFYRIAQEELLQGTHIAFSPEGNSYSTEESPGKFRKGVFRLASSPKEQPLVVPLVMVNFDKLPSQATYKCAIMPPFRMQDYGVTHPDSKHLSKAIEKINKKYQRWVADLSKDDSDFKREIQILKQKAIKKKDARDLIVFYGSSTLRLWKNVAKDFPDWNTLNLGFGGAFIHSLDKYFDVLFSKIQPKSIVLYLGGNDLTLGYSSSKIVDEILSFIKRIHSKFPKTDIYNISIKPSLERAGQLDKIKMINHRLKTRTDSLEYFHQIDFYQSLILNNKIRKDHFLQDGLHLNSNGYEVLKNCLNQSLSQ